MSGGERPVEIGVGLIGTGFMGKSHGLAFRSVSAVFRPPPAAVRLAVIADVGEDLARSAAEAYGFARWTPDWREVVAAPDVDLVDITLPNYLHKEVALAAIAAGKHVYCEKPLANTAADAWEMAEAAERAGVRTMVGFNYLRNPAIALARQIIDGGELGEIRHFRGWFDLDAVADPDAPFSWRFDRALAGSGALGDLGSHVIAFARHLVGEITRVSAKTAIHIPSRPAGEGAYGYRNVAASGAPGRAVENDDVVSALVEFATGASGVIEANRVATGRRYDLGLQVIGSRGSLAFSQQRMHELQLFTAGDPPGRGGLRSVQIGPEHPWYGHFWPIAGLPLGLQELKTIEVHDLLAGLATGTPVWPDFREGWQVCRVIDAILESDATGRWIDVATI